ncbi:MAG: hypothetical protein HQL14_08290 [Candidatus Omnitrophica bacterium]|nr:hypothetical protein [Candidatus Omnitrophota bacterium]
MNRLRKLITSVFAIIFISAAQEGFTAEVYYLGGTGQGGNGSQVNPSYSLKQRFLDLINFSPYNPSRSGRLSGYFSQEIDHNDVSGNISKSFLERKTLYVTETNLNLMEKLGGDYNLQGQLFVRKSDDPRVDVRKDVRIKQFDLKVMNPENLYEFGEFYGDFSQLALGSSLQGAHIELSPRQDQKYQIIVGRKNEADSAAGLFQRNVGGLKADHYFFENSKLFSNFRLGLQAATSDDDPATLERTSTTKNMKNTVVSTDGEITTRGPLSLLYEYAYSFYEPDEDAGGAHTDKAGALRVSPRIRFNNWGFKYLYYTVSPKFYSDLGSAMPDKTQHQFSADYRFNPKASVELVENYYYDHLAGSSQTKRTTNDEKDVTFIFKPIDNRPSLMIRPYMNYIQTNSDDPGNTAQGLTKTFGVGFNDVIRIIDLSYGAKYEYRSFDDEANGTSTEVSNRIGFNVSREQKIFGHRLYLSLDPQMDFRRNKSNPDSKTDGTVGLGFNGQYDITSRLVVRGGHNLNKFNAAQSANSYMQTRSFGELDLALNKAKSAHFVTRYEFNHYGYQDSSQSYNENRVIGKFLINF